VNISLIGQGGVEGVDEEYVERAVRGDGRVVGEVAGWQGRRGSEVHIGRGRRSGVLFKVADLLGGVVFEDGEVGRLEAVDRLLMIVGDDYVYHDEIRAGFEGDAGVGGCG
jgi:hypothetical protein